MNNYNELFKKELNNRNYASNTIKAYTFYIDKFLCYAKSTDYNPETRISEFLGTFKSTEEKRVCYAAIHLFYKIILKKECPYTLDLVRRRKRIPIVLDRDEILTIINSISNSKHSLMISMLYGSGLRVSEIVNMKVEDLDFANNIIYVRNSKGNKDRISTLSENLKEDLIKETKNRTPGEFVFINKNNKKYAIRTIQQIFKNALYKSGIKKKATCHTLRHSFATHLLQKGIDIRTLKDLLGHKSVKTTMIYLHITDPLQRQVKSPL